MAERGKFPIENAEDFVNFARENHVVEPVVAVDKRNLPIIGGDARFEPRNQFADAVDRLDLARRILLRPAAELAFEIISGNAEIGETDGCNINVVQGGQRLVHRVVDFPAVGWRIFSTSSFSAGSQKIRPSR